VKSSKEIIKISKFFKKNTDKKDQKKFAQATSLSTTSSLASIIRDTLNIKKTFPNLQNKKIKNI